MTYPRLVALGPIMSGEPYDAIRNPLLFNLVYPGHPQHGSSLCLETFKQLKITLPSIEDPARR